MGDSVLHPAAPAAPGGAPAVLEGRHDLASVTHDITRVPLSRRPPRWWLMAVSVAFLGVMVFMYAVGMLLVHGVGIWGINMPVGWGFAIINLVWWIGIGHAGTLISAILLLLRQEWRTSINRFAEAMTLFAVACAGMFPLLHLGRMWKFYYILPVPNTLGMWPQWRSPLVWDVFAIGTYATISLVFWYVGLVPDLATLRDRATRRWPRAVYGILAMGWRNSARHWHRYRMAYLLLAGLATPLVVSVHSVVALDFAISILPGWHTTVFPPYFVAGAIFSGFAMVVTLVVPIRAWFGFKDFITIRHLDNMGKIMLATGLIVAYGYLMETFGSWYSGHEYEQFLVWNRAFGPYAASFWALMLCNVLIPQSLWFGAVRRSPVLLLLVSLVVNTGMWLERYVIVITSLHRDFLPSSWGMYYPTVWDWATYIGTIGLFLFLILLFLRTLPAISIFEVREMVAEHKRHEHEGNAE